MLVLTLWIIAAAGVLFPSAFDPVPGGRDLVRRGLVALLLGAAFVAPSALLAFVALSAVLLLQAAATGTRTGAAGLVLAGVAALVAGVAFATGVPALGLASSFASVALRSGVIPLHVGAAALAERHPALLTELAGSAVAAAFVHLRFAVPGAPDLAHDLATGLVLWGAFAALAGALLATAQTTLRGLWSASFTMHGGMLLAALGAAGRGHVVGAVFVAVTLSVALAGFGATVSALEARVGPVRLDRDGGRARTFPALSAGFAFFAAAGIAMPGTAGFVADDLLLHALWEESPLACGTVLVASATLAIALLKGFSAVFLGPEGHRSIAPDLRTRERLLVALGIVVLVGIGVAPMLLIGPTVAFFG